MPQLIAYRGLQGLGAGGIMPVVLTILGDIFTLEETAANPGPVQRGVGHRFSGRSGIGVVSDRYLGLEIDFLRESSLWLARHDRADAILPRPGKTALGASGSAGNFSLAVACMALLTLLSRLGPGGWPWHVSAILAAVAIASAIFFMLNERNSANPVMPVDLLMNLSIGPSSLGSFLLGIGFLSLDTFVPLYVQGVRGGGPGAAAWVVTPVMLTGPSPA